MDAASAWDSSHSLSRAKLDTNGTSIPFFSVYIDIHFVFEGILDHLIHGRVCFPNAHHRDRLALRLFALSDIALHIIAARVRLCVQCSLVFWSSLAFKVPCFCRPATKISFRASEKHIPQCSPRGDQTYRPVALLMSPPSSTGISRLSPAPDAAEPTVTVEPGNLFVAASLMPESEAMRWLVNVLRDGVCGFTGVASSLLHCVRVEVTLSLLSDG